MACGTIYKLVFSLAPCPLPLPARLHTHTHLPHRCRNQDDARDTFKTLKSQHIGDQYAGLYAEWAALENMDSNAFKALSVLAKGLKERAEPSR
jgi:hypothetical protein